MNHQDTKLIFFGTGSFAEIILDYIKNEFKNILIITEPDKPAGRKQILTPSLVKVLANKYNLEIWQPDSIKTPEFIQQIKDQKPDIILIADYGKIIPLDVIKIPKYGSLNIHPSLLPKYRGPSPIQNTILNNDQETGATLMLIDEEVDHGPIIKQAIYNIDKRRFTSEELLKELAILGAKLFVETLPLWMSGEIKAIPQDHSKAVFTKKIKKEDGLIDWSLGAEAIDARFRAYQPWPGVYTYWRDQRLKIIDLLASPLQPLPDHQDIGLTYLDENKELSVQCKEGAIIIKKLQMEGKKEMSAQEFLAGHHDFLGSKLGRHK